MKDRPILFSAPMVRALLADQKTQTRRIVDPRIYIEPQNEDGTLDEDGKLTTQADPEFGRALLSWGRKPYGVAGDQLWVRETWGYRGSGWSSDRPDVEDFYVEYQADGSRRTFTHPTGFRRGIPKQPKRKPRDEFADEDAWEMHRDDTLSRWWKSWRPSIFLPRWASRITLEVTSVRVERLQDISLDDCAAEGVQFPPNARSVGNFAVLWESINGAGSWKANPWVWAISFRRVTP